MRKALSSLAVFAAIGGFLAFLDLDWSLFFSGDPRAAAEQLHDKVAGVGNWKYLLFVFLMVVPPLFLVPVTLLSLVIALMFEPLEAGIVLFLGYMGNTLFCFWLARALGHEAVEKHLMRDRGMLAQMEKDSESWGIGVVILWRFLPVPYAWPGLAAGLTRMRLSTVLMGTAVISVFWAAFYSLATESILRGDAKLLLTAMGILAGLTTVGWLMRRARALSPEPAYRGPAFPLTPESPARGPVLEMLSIPGDGYCDDARAELVELREKLGFEVQERDVREDPEAKTRYGDQVPVLLLDGVQLFSYQVDSHTLEVRLKEKAEGKVWTGGNTWSGDDGDAA